MILFKEIRNNKNVFYTNTHSFFTPPLCLHQAIIQKRAEKWDERFIFQNLLLLLPCIIQNM